MKPKEPRNLIEAVRYFSDLEVATKYLSQLRWPDGIECPHCKSKEQHSYVSTRRIWKCKSCRKQFSPKAGTIFEDSAIGLDKWLTAVWMIANSKNGVSSYEIARSLGITQKSGWFMMHRIRLAMQTGTFVKAVGQVEIDETFIGQKAKNMHKGMRAKKITGTGGKDKVAVMGILERGGSVRAMVVPSRRKRSLQAVVREHVAPGAHVFTYALKSYEGPDPVYVHQAVDHAVEYVREHVHTNGIENFWSLLKRTLHGTYVSVDPSHLFRYVDEQAFRFNSREGVDGDRFRELLGRISGKRLTYREVTKKQLDK